ncbi:hypothetical protein CFAM422_010108 [Trichoderma lentiforme]|uniref:NAD(P)-binding domain-containing protein n=1 Tax=Trichoderma lentiforme TaxID=1567552 RepID=A0A9P4X8N8_9HYPO|nr:hypothetical protein CFAM422_010108 [Trichoderma lentiforme]
MRIFAMGITGFIGGQVIASLLEKRSKCHIRVLVRDEAKAQQIAKKWANIEIVKGDLDSHDVLVEEAKKADIVLQMADADHTGAIRSLIEGLERGTKGYYIHTSGAAFLFDVTNGFGNPSNKVSSDVTDLEAIKSLDLALPHRVADALVMELSTRASIPTAIVCPPMIYGIGAGPVKTRSIQIPRLIRAILKREKAFTVGEGNNIWGNVHIQDVADVYLRLIEETLKPNGGAASWGQEGLYFAQAAEHRWVDAVKSIAEEAFDRDCIKTTDIDKLTAEEVSSLDPLGSILWGSNCRSNAERIQALGWQPKGPPMYESIAAEIEAELASNS